MNGLVQSVPSPALRQGLNLAEIAAAGAAAQAAARANIGSPAGSSDLLDMVTRRSVEPVLFSDGTTASRRAELTPGAVGAFAGHRASFPFDFEVPTSNPAATFYSVYVGPNGAGASGVDANAFVIYVTTGGALSIRQNGAAGADYRILEYAGFVTAYAGQWVRGVVVFEFGDSTTAPKIYLAGADITASFALLTAGAVPNWMPAALNATKFQNGNSLPAGRFVPLAPILGVITAAEVLTWTLTGRLPRWCELGTGNVTALYTSDFSAGVNGWSGQAGLAAGNIDGISDGIVSKDNCLRYTGDGLANYPAMNRAITLTAGIRYRIQFDYYIPAANALIKKFYLTSAADIRQNGASVSAFAIAAVSGAWTAVEADFVATSTSIVLGLATAADGTNAANTDLAYMHNVVITRLGPLARWEVQPGAVIHADSGENRLALVTVPGITALGDLPQTVVLPGAPLTANGFVHLDQVITPAGYELVAVYALQVLTAVNTITVKETSAGGTTVATGPLSATAARVALTVSNGLLAGGKKLYLTNSSWGGNTVTPFFVFRRAG